MVKFFTLLMRLRGQDPTRAGRNKDINFTKLGLPRRKIHAVIDYRAYWDVKRKASACHASQGGGTSNSRSLPEWFQRQFLARETFIRAVPPAPDGFRENDLFAGVKVT
jgi:LmbE family N-acetylglucosaminyl deacetylase